MRNRPTPENWTRHGPGHLFVQADAESRVILGRVPRTKARHADQGALKRHTARRPLRKAAAAAHAAPAARASLSTAAATAFGGGVYAGRGYPQPEKLEPPPPEALEVQDTPAELPGTASTPGDVTPQPEKPARPRRELIGDHVEVPIIEEKGELQDSQTRPRVYGQRGQELPAAARPKSGKVPRMGTPQGRPRGRGTPAGIKTFSRQVRRR